MVIISSLSLIVEVEWSAPPVVGGLDTKCGDLLMSGILGDEKATMAIGRRSIHESRG